MPTKEKLTASLPLTAGFVVGTAAGYVLSNPERRGIVIEKLSSATETALDVIAQAPKVLSQVAERAPSVTQTIKDAFPGRKPPLILPEDL
jgi:hypothetical protein